MLNEYFSGDQAHRRHRATPFGAFIDGYVAHRRSQGRCCATIRKQLWHIASFGEHLNAIGNDSIWELDESHLESFVDSYLSVPNPRGGGRRKGRLILPKMIRTSLRILLTYLRDIGVVRRPNTPLLDEFCPNDWKRARHLDTPFGKYLEQYVAYRRSQGYCFTHLQKTLRYMSAFGEYLKANGVDSLGELGESDQEGFIESYLANPPPCGRRRSTRALEKPLRAHVRRLLAYLRDLGVVSPVRPPPESPSSSLIDDYISFLQVHRGLAPATVEGHRRWVTAFVEATARRSVGVENLSELSARNVQAVVTDFARPLGLRTRQNMISAVNSFLGFLRDNGIIPRAFRFFLPRISNHALASLPSHVKPDDIERVLHHADRSTPLGRRNYAILILLTTYGLRAVEVAELRLEQIDWRHSKLVIWQSKTRRNLLLPLLPRVREALVDYVRNGRPDTQDRQVFQKVQAPLGPITRASIFQIVRGAFRKAGIEAQSCGARVLRHSLATAVIRSGQSLKLAGDLLGHRVPESTLTYCKLAVEDLRAVALDVPEAAS